MKIAAIATNLCQDENLEAWKNACEVLKHIYSSYGKVANRKEFRDAIKETDEYTAALLDYLVEQRAFTYTNIKYLLKHITKAYNEKNALTQVRIHQKFSKKVEASWDKAEIENTETIGITVHDQNKIYKRTLDTDLHKLLD
jgi:hypothetical protein